MISSSHQASVEALYLRHDAALRRFLARQLRCEEAAAEVAQEAWARLLRLLPPRGLRNSQAYVFQVGAHLAADRLARERRQMDLARQALVDGETFLGEMPGTEAATLAVQRLRLLADAVDDLPPRCREVFLKSRIDGLSNGEIADRLGISRNMVEKHISRAMLHCRRRLDAGGW